MESFCCPVDCFLGFFGRRVGYGSIGRDMSLWIGIGESKGELRGTERDMKAIII